MPFQGTNRPASSSGQDQTEVVSRLTSLAETVTSISAKVTAADTEAAGAKTAAEAAEGKAEEARAAAANIATLIGVRNEAGNYPAGAQAASLHASIDRAAVAAARSANLIVARLPAILVTGVISTRSPYLTLSDFSVGTVAVLGNPTSRDQGSVVQSRATLYWAFELRQSDLASAAPTGVAYYPILGCPVRLDWENVLGEADINAVTTYLTVFNNDADMVARRNGVAQLVSSRFRPVSPNEIARLRGTVITRRVEESRTQFRIGHASASESIPLQLANTTARLFEILGYVDRMPARAAQVPNLSI